VATDTTVGANDPVGTINISMAAHTAASVVARSTAVIRGDALMITDTIFATISDSTDDTARNTEGTVITESH
jgi:hypothetical protein